MPTHGPKTFRVGPESEATYGYVMGALGTSLEFAQVNPRLPLGYLGYETDTGKMKVGDGTTDWNSLPYVLRRLNADERSVSGVDTQDDIIVDISTKGLVLKDDASPAHYWRVTINSSGVLQTTDLGTTKP